MNKIADDIVIRDCSVEEWKKCVEMAFIHEGWGMALDDLKVLKAALGDQKYRVLVAITGGHEVVGFSNIGLYESFHNDLPMAHLGGYLVLPEYRGLGIGTKLFETALTLFPDSNFGLVAAPNMAAKYASKFGFKLTLPDFQMKRYLIGTDQINVDRLKSDSRYSICDVTDENIDALAKFDEQIMPTIKRYHASKVLFRDPIAIIKVVMGEAGEIVGICGLRKMAQTRLRIRVWYGINEEVAECGLKAVLEALSDLSPYRSLEVSAPIRKAKNVKALLEKLVGNKVKADEPTPAPFLFTKAIPPINFDLVYSLNRLNFA